jgi:hypothetical protein
MQVGGQRPLRTPTRALPIDGEGKSAASALRGYFTLWIKLGSQRKG